MNDTISRLKGRIMGLVKEMDKLGGQAAADVKQAVSPLFEAIEEKEADDE